MGSTKAGEESASQLHFRDNIFQGGFAFWFCNKYWWALEWIALGLSASTGVLLYIVEMSLRILGVTLKSVFGDDVWGSDRQMSCLVFMRNVIDLHPQISFEKYKETKIFRLYYTLILSEMKICSEVTRWTSCWSFDYGFYWWQVDHWHIVSHGSPEVQNGFLWSLLETS